MIDEPILPVGLVKARRTPIFTLESLPAALVASHRTTVWAELHVQSGSVRYIDLEGETRRDIRVDAGRTAVIVPGIAHRVEPSTDAALFVQFYRQPGADSFPGERQRPPTTGAEPGNTEALTSTRPPRPSRWSPADTSTSYKTTRLSRAQLLPGLHWLASTDRRCRRLLEPCPACRPRLRDQHHRKPPPAAPTNSVHARTLRSMAPNLPRHHRRCLGLVPTLAPPTNAPPTSCGQCPNDSSATAPGNPTVSCERRVMADAVVVLFVVW